MHLQSSVGSMNRLARDLAVAGGSTPVRVANALRPPLDWPWSAVGDRRASVLAATAAVLGHRPLSLTRYYAKPRGSGIPVDRWGFSRDRGTFLAVGEFIEVEGNLGPARLETDGVRATLEIPDDLPETIVTALPGRGVDELFDHPLLAGRGYQLEGVERRDPASLAITFVTGVVPIFLPWAALLRGAGV